MENFFTSMILTIIIGLLVFVGYRFYTDWREKCLNKQLAEFLKKYKD
ncbi:hypothetical protein ACFGZ5_11845 [Pasteurella multocida]